MGGAFYRNSSSGRNERHDRRDDRAMPNNGKKPLPANIRVNSHENAAVAPLADEEPLPKTSPFKPLSFLKEKRTDKTKPETGTNEKATLDKTLTADPPQKAATETQSKARPQTKPEGNPESFASRFTGQASKVGKAGKPGDDNTSRGWHVRITPSTLLTLVILFVVTLAFFFLFGLIVGRGSVPPAQVPQLEKLPPSVTQTPDTPEAILSEEDLQFMTNLKTDNPAQAAGNALAPGTSALPAKQNVTSKQDAPKAAQTKEKESSKESASQKPTPDKTQYDFVLRAAAFKAEDQADSLRARLEGNGIRTRLIREKASKVTWYHVQVLYRGTQEGLEQLRAGLKKYAINDSIVASKTPVS